MPRPGAGERTRLLLLGVLALAHLLLSLFHVVPGYLSIDEAVYDKSVHDLLATGSLDIRTGYQEFPSPESAHAFFPVNLGRPVSQYPYLFPVVALPFYALMGYRGLFLLNALAFVGVAWLCFSLALRLFRDRVLALDACLLFGAGTFAWDYSQAAWPHMVSLLFMVGAMFLMVKAFQAGSLGAAALPALGAGLVAGLAPGIRLEGFLLLPCVVLPFLFAWPWRLREAFLVLAGMVPGLALLSWTNLLKTGTFTPFSYGNLFGDVMILLAGPVVLAGGAALILAWVLSRPFAVSFLDRRRWVLPGGAVALLAVLLAFPATRGFLAKGVSQAFSHLIDLRTIRPDLVEAWVPRTAGGGVVYLWAQKKALLQSVPWLAAVVIPALALGVKGKERGTLALLFLVPLAVAGYHGYWGYEGGLCLNMRLLLPTLPFLSILAAWGLHRLARRWGTTLGAGGWAVAVAVTTSGFLALTRLLATTVDRQETPLLAFPLAIAVAFLLLLGCGELLRGRPAALARRAAWLAVAVGVGWGGAVTFLYDYPHHRERRVYNQQVGEEMLRLIPPDSVLFVPEFPDPFLPLQKEERIRVAFPSQDLFADFPRLVEGYLGKGWRVFGAFPGKKWVELLEGPLRGYDFAPLGKMEWCMVGEIVPGGHPGDSTP